MSALASSSENTVPLSGPVALPDGTVTFLFTDIVDSSSLWERTPAAMPAAMARHDQLVQDTVSGQGGMVVKQHGEGDSVFAVFVRASQALAAACSLQAALQREAWPGGLELHVRMALHTGEAQVRDGDYYGLALSRCARLRAMAHGGQLLASEAAVQSAEGSLPPGITLRALGAHRLRGLQRPEQIFQVLHPALPDRFPALVSSRAASFVLPQPLTSFVGRSREAADIGLLLDGARLLTLTGTGGSGKTRLALHVASQASDAYPGGLCLVELAALSDPNLVAQTVASALGARETADGDLDAALCRALSGPPRLLILDNCEHLIAACAALVERLLRTCDDLHILTTSREALGIGGEKIYQVRPLPLPELRSAMSPELLSQNEAVRLFVERAQISQPDFVLNADNAAAVVRLCRALDGIPLALELAAARVSVLSPQQIADRLSNRFRLLTGGSRLALPRQQTMQAAVDWSYHLLSDAERLLFERLAIFAGGWTLEAAESVCAGDGVDEWDVLDLLSLLRDKSLVQVEDTAGQKRYRMLETLRQYAAQRPPEGHGLEATRARYGAWCLALAQQAEPELRGSRQGVWLETLNAEHDNLRAALATAFPEEQLRLASALHRFWLARGYVGEGRGWLEGALLRAQDQDSLLYAHALNAVGILAWAQADYESADAFQQRALEIYRAQGDQNGEARTLADLGILADFQEEAAQARAFYEDSLAQFRVLGDTRHQGFVLVNLAAHFIAQEDSDAAVPLLIESLTIRRALGDTAGIATALLLLAQVAFQQQHWDEAHRHLRESLELRRSLGDSRGMIGCLYQMARTDHATEDTTHAVRLLATVEAVRETMDVPFLPDSQHEYDQFHESLQQTLGKEVFDDLWHESQTLPLAQAIQDALTD